MAILVTTTGTLSPVLFDDLGGRQLIHPTVDIDFELEYDSEDLSNSIDIQDAINLGYITIKDELGNSITNISEYTISGHMTKTVYDVNKDSVVDDTEKFAGYSQSYYLNRSNHTGTQSVSTIPDLYHNTLPSLDGGTSSEYFHSTSLEHSGLKILDGMALDKPLLNVLDSTGLKLDISNINGGDITFMIDGNKSILNCTTGSGVGGAARVSLTEGTSTAPVTNFIYVTNSNGIATLISSTTLPTGSFSWVGKIIVPDALTFATTGPYAMQRFTESFSNQNRGALSHSREKLRALGALYLNGGSHTLDITGANLMTVHLNIQSAEVYQLHRQSFPAFATGPYYYGNGINPYTKVTDLGQVLTLSDGTAIQDGKFYSLVIWGAVNYSTNICKLYVNRPSGVDKKTSRAISDRDNYADYTVPNDMRSVAFLIARVVLEYNAVLGFTAVGDGSYSLLGTPVGFRSGGGGGTLATNDFEDTLFRIYDDIDTTKQLAFELSNVSTGTTRTLTVPNRSGTIAISKSNTVIVNSLTDFPVAVAGAITLLAGTQYIVTGAINIGTDHLVLSNNTSLVGTSAFISSLTYTGTGGAIRGIDVTCSLSNLTFIASAVGGKVFDFSNVGKTKTVSILECVVANSTEVGTITGFDTVLLSIINYVGNSAGWTFTGVHHLFLLDQSIKSTNTGTFISLPSGTFDTVIISRCYIDVTLASTGLNIVYATVVINEFINITSNLIEGAGTLITGFTAYDLRIHSFSNIGLDDSIALGSMYWTGNVGTMTNAGTSAKITGGTSIAGTLQRFTHTSPNRLTYIGLESISFNVNVALASYYSTGAAFIAEISVAKNGIVIASSVNAFTVYTADEPTATNTEVTLATNDYIEVFVKDVTGASGNFIISYINVQIQGK